MLHKVNDNVTNYLHMLCNNDHKCVCFPQSITVGNGPLDQLLVYGVYYSGTMKNVTSPTTELTFTAPSLPDGVFVSNITISVTAINRFGYGTPSDPDYFEISEYIYICVHQC